MHLELTKIDWIAIVFSLVGLITMLSGCYERIWFGRLARNGYLPDQTGWNNTRLLYIFSGGVCLGAGIGVILESVFLQKSGWFFIVGLAVAFAICNAHQIRDLQYAIDAGDTLFAPPMQALLREGLRLTQDRERYSQADFQHAADSLKTKARALLELTPQQTDAIPSQKRFRKHFESIWHFLDRPDVPFTYNASERVRRPAVIHRKVIGGFRSEAGVTAYTLYRTVDDTARRRG